MTERELRDNILFRIYNRKDKLFISTETFCEEEGIEFENDNQRKRIFETLKDRGYINAFFKEGGDGTIASITPKGIDYVENSIVESLKETDRLVKEGKLELDVEELTNNNPDQKSEAISETIYLASENYEKHKDQSVEPCFGVETLADCFLKQLDTIVDSDSKNICMVGIFAPWGRGKSYFFNNVKGKIGTRNKNLKESEVYYDVVEFNAWKYQETPAIWAYLFETLYHHKCWGFRLWYPFKHNWKPILGDAILFALPFILVLLTTTPDSKIQCEWAWSTGALGVSGWLLTTLIKHYNSAISFIKKYGKGISFSKELGLQAEIEKETTALLKTWIFNWCGRRDFTKKKIILYVDDIDRCSETKMVSIIDSLRTVLENDEIRKRLIIICSIDAEKIKKGIGYKFKELYDEKELNKIAIEQLDKIFLTGISLPPLDKEQLKEYVAKLAQIQNTNNFPSERQPSAPYSIFRTKHSFLATDKFSEELKIDNKVILEWISEFINSGDIKITPRKLRVIYYRILLANNILSSSNTDALFIKNIASAIFNLSCCLTCSMESDEALFDIVEMVVPYKIDCDKE